MPESFTTYSSGMTAPQVWIVSLKLYSQQRTHNDALRNNATLEACIYNRDDEVHVLVGGEYAGCFHYDEKNGATAANRLSRWRVSKAARLSTLYAKIRGRALKAYARLATLAK